MMMVHPRGSSTGDRGWSKSAASHGRATVFVAVLALLAVLYLADLDASTLRGGGGGGGSKKEGATRTQTVDSSSSGGNTVPVEQRICENALRSFEEEGIRMVALDFDLTVIDVHTGGIWEEDWRDLVPHVRPEFRCLMEGCLQRNIRLAVATYSEQIYLIQKVLMKSLSLSKETMEEKFPIYGRQHYIRGLGKGKQSQLKHALDFYNNNNKEAATQRTTDNIRVTISSTVLIDDDPNNIRVAHRDGYYTVLYRPDQSDIDLTLQKPIVN